jgi:predicted RNA-binding protein with PUA-like domain
MNYWLCKSEGDCYSIDDLKRDKATAWTGVRNYQARNFMRDQMSVGDGILFYHSNSKPNGVYGLAKVARIAHPDETQFKSGKYFDPKATRENPRWFCVDIAFVKKFDEPVGLTEIKTDPSLGGMMLRQNGRRLSIQPVSEKHFKYIAEQLTD